MQSVSTHQVLRWVWEFYLAYVPLMMGYKYTRFEILQQGLCELNWEAWDIDAVFLEEARGVLKVGSGVGGSVVDGSPIEGKTSITIKSSFHHTKHVWPPFVMVREILTRGAWSSLPLPGIDPAFTLVVDLLVTHPLPIPSEFKTFVDLAFVQALPWHSGLSVQVYSSVCTKYTSLFQRPREGTRVKHSALGEVVTEQQRVGTVLSLLGHVLDLCRVSQADLEVGLDKTRVFLGLLKASLVVGKSLPSLGAEEEKKVSLGSGEENTTSIKGGNKRTSPVSVTKSARLLYTTLHDLRVCLLRQTSHPSTSIEATLEEVLSFLDVVGVPLCQHFSQAPPLEETDLVPPSTNLLASLSSKVFSSSTPTLLSPAITYTNDSELKAIQREWAHWRGLYTRWLVPAMSTHLPQHASVAGTGCCVVLWLFASASPHLGLRLIQGSVKRMVQDVTVRGTAMVPFLDHVVGVHLESASRHDAGNNKCFFMSQCDIDNLEL